MRSNLRTALKCACIILATAMIFNGQDLYAHYVTTLHDDTVFYSDESCTVIADKGITAGNSFWIDDEGMSSALSSPEGKYSCQGQRSR